MISIPEPSPIQASFFDEYIDRAIQRGRMSHAYLLLGSPPSHGAACALELARRIFCETAAEAGGRSCGACTACRCVDHDNHPGVGVYRAREGKNVVDIETVREMCERSHYSREHVFVAILLGADSMMEPAANALLKTLEEPPGSFVIVLTAASAGSLLPTIVSRCHRLYLPPGPASEGETIDRKELAALWRPDFFARNDIREWLSRVAPEEKTARDRVREVSGALIEDLRGSLGSVSDEALDDALRRLEVLLDLRGSLDGLVSPDLVLEQIIATLRS